MKINVNSPALNNSTLYKNQTNRSYNCVSFGCEETNKKAKSKFFEAIEKPYNSIVDKIAKGMSKIIKSKGFKSLINNVNDMGAQKVTQHITLLTSLILSGFYIEQTLTKKELDKKKRTTLAINQAAVTIFSGISSYTLDNFIATKTNKLIEKYVAVNATNKSIGKLVAGIKSAQSLIVFGTIYRFIAPVLITPIANAIGNKVNENQEVKFEGNKTSKAVA